MAERLTTQARPLVISPPPSMLEVDEHATASDDSTLLASASITSSITQWEWENGRRYHAYKAGSYPLPNDEQELDRIDLKHHIMMLLCDAHLHLAPLQAPKRILDIGTGTGIWAMEMAEQYPESMIWGTDLSPVQPSWVPNNVRFEIDDCEAKEWTWPENYFDYIHSRFMLASIGNWPRLVQKAFQHIKPGGYFEMQELDPRFRSDDGSLSESSTLSYWSKLICDASAKYNRPIPHHDELIPWFEQAGFVDVTRVCFKSPTNPWPKDPKLKEVGKFQLVAHIEGTEGISLGLLTRAEDWKPEEINILMAKIRPELKDRNIHSYQRNAIVVGRKPEISRTPDSFRGQGLLSPSSYPQSPRENSSFSFHANGHPQDQSPNPTLQDSSKDSLADETNTAFTPVLDISQAPSNGRSQNRGSLAS